MTAAAMKIIIKEIIDSQNQLLELALLKTEAIKNGDADAVNRCTRMEEPLVGKLSDLNRKRESMVAEDVGNSGDADPAPTFGQWLQHTVPESEQGAWQDLYAGLLQSVVSLKRANQLNQDMLRQSLQWVSISLNMLHPQGKTSAYGNPHSDPRPSTPFTGRIDSRA